jgi:predicted MFS family arabinose efflux permease
MGSIVGLILGGVLINGNVFGLGWRMIFLVNLPVGIVGLLGALVLLKESRSPSTLHIDGIGVGMLFVALFLLTYPLVVGRSLGWPLWSLLCLVGSLPVLFIFARYERYKSRKDGSPLVELTLFRERNFVLGLVITFVFYAGIVSFLLILTLYLQTGLHYTALAAGLTTVPMGLGFFLASTSAIKVAPLLGERRTLALGMVVMALGLISAWLTVSSVGAELREISLVAVLFIYGLGEGFVLPTLVNTVLRGIQSRDAGSIAGVFTTMQQISGAIGVAIIGILFFGQLAIHANIASQQLTSPLQRALQAEGLPRAEIRPLVSTFQVCFADQTSESDSTRQPESCQRLASESEISHQTTSTVLQIIEQANGQNYASAFAVAVWYNIGLLLITLVLTFWLPRKISP